jgi:hypothetical protein
MGKETQSERSRGFTALFAISRIQSAVAARFEAEQFEGVTVQPMIRDADGYELILGSSPDPQFGPVLLFGLGGQLVEIFRDRTLALPPLTSTLARRMMERTKIYKALAGVRGRAPVDRSALEQILIRFGQLISETPRIKEADLNPLLASPNAIVALDARILLHDWNVPDRDLPRTAIRPYPSVYVERWIESPAVPYALVDLCFSPVCFHLRSVTTSFGGEVPVEFGPCSLAVHVDRNIASCQFALRKRRTKGPVDLLHLLPAVRVASRMNEGHVGRR